RPCRPSLPPPSVAFVVLFACYVRPLFLHSFPTRRSSDLSSFFQEALFQTDGEVPYLHIKNGRKRNSVQAAYFDWSLEPSRFEPRSEEHTSELQSRENLVCRLLLEKKNLFDYPFYQYYYNI